MDSENREAVLASWRVDEVVDRRRHAARERELLAAELRLDELWSTWAATGVEVVLHTEAGREHHGRVVGVGADFVAVEPVTGPIVAVRTAAVTSVSTAELALSGAAVAGSATTLGELARELADRQVDAPLVSSTGLSIRGRIEAGGFDAVVVRAPGGRRTYLRVDALSELSSMSMTSSSW